LLERRYFANDSFTRSDFHEKPTKNNRLPK
jgi:hypothetical protein